MHEDELGPIGYVVVELPGGRFSERGFAMLLDAVERGTVRVLDLEFVAKDGDGTLRKVEVGEIPNPDNVDLSAYEGVSSGLLDESDVVGAGAMIEPGSLAGILVFENVWAIALAEALGARLVASSGLSADDIVAALDATEPA